MNKRFLVAFIIFILFFVCLSLFIHNNLALTTHEAEIIKNIQIVLKKVPVIIPKSITYFGHETAWLLTAIFCGCCILFCKKLKAFLIYLIALPCTELIYSFLKTVIERPRPPVNMRLIDVTSSSFPSGHSTLSMVTYGLLIYFIFKHVKNESLKITLTVILSLLILLIGFTRVWLGVHFPTDILGGFSLGICIICVCAIIYESITPSEKPKYEEPDFYSQNFKN